MTITKMMIKVLMDGINDANMMIDYAEEAKEQRHAEATSFFRVHAKKRIDAVDNDLDKLDEILHLSQKASSGDEMAKAFLDYLDTEVEKLNSRYMAI